ncbi:Cytochrome P450 9e2 [Eumeta japonica]|uniref:unspecific monooxygenase n=1 Tax=Eumeta variegata TaxID=151549 RepID=A0A4C1UIY1_EUMVA|nr:Cytochrome P450 9e2 [Eumeta japonica]
MILYIWLCVPLVALWLYLRKTYAYFKDRGVNHLPPVPVLGNMARPVFRKEHAIHNLCRLYSAFPEDRFVGIYEFVNKLTVIRDPELLRAIGVKDFDCFSDHRLFTSKEDRLFAKSLFGLTGQKWRDMRSTLSPAFTGSKLRGMVPLIQDCSKNLVRQLNEEMKESKSGYLDLDSKDLFSRYANDVIATCAFGLQVNSVAEKNNTFHAMGTKMTKFEFVQLAKMFIMIIFPFINKFVEISMFSKNAIDYFSKIVLRTIKDREENNIHRPDLIQILLEAKKGTLTHENVKDEKDAGFATVEESNIGKGIVKRAWDDDHLAAQAILFFFGGFETVSTTMVFLIYELAVNPDVQSKLRQEIDKCYKENQGKIDYDTINQIKYLDMVLSESLRKWPPLPAIDRICQKRYNLGKPHNKATKDYYLETGSIVFIPIWPIHYDPRYYSEPTRFNPERFSDDNKHNIKPFTYMPFGIGPRNCIGSRFAITEVKAMVFELLRNFEVTPSPKTRVPAELDPSNFTMRLLGGNYIRMKPRNSSVL